MNTKITTAPCTWLAGISSMCQSGQGVRAIIHPRNDYRSFQQLVRRTGLRRIRLHDLRHTAASLLLAQGVAARVVMEILGHSQVSITLDTYTHVDPELNRVATDPMQELLWPEED